MHLNATPLYNVKPYGLLWCAMHPSNIPLPLNPPTVEATVNPALYASHSLIIVTMISECEAYNAGFTVASTVGGFKGNGIFEGCIAHHNRPYGFTLYSGVALRCIAHKNTYNG